MNMVDKVGTIGILVGGGPAPGINSVIGARLFNASSEDARCWEYETASDGLWKATRPA